MREQSPQNAKNYVNSADDLIHPNLENQAAHNQAKSDEFLTGLPN